MDLNAADITETFNVNLYVFSSSLNLEPANIQRLGPLLLMKHFSPLLPGKTIKPTEPVIWINITARVGSIEDNRLGGWYSYRATKAGLNQAMKTFDIYLKTKHPSAFAVSMHPGTVKTGLSEPFWSGVPEGGLFEPEDSASKLLNVVERLKMMDRGGFFDWKGDKIPW